MPVARPACRRGAIKTPKDSLEAPADTHAPEGAPDAVILAGGAGRRMGGRDKGLIPLRGRPLIEHVALVLRPHCARLWVAARDTAAYQALGFAVLDDGPWAGAGPLAGIRAALAVSRAPLLVVAPCDAPALPADLVARLCVGLGASPAAYAHDGTRAHFACAVLRGALAPAVTAFLERGERSLGDFLRGVGAQGVDFGGCAASFLNLNTPQDLARATRLAATA